MAFLLSVSREQDFTETLLEVRAGREGAFDHLFSRLYPELKAIARGQRRRLGPGRSLDTTALVHETYLKFVDQARVDLNDRQHFYAVAARAMRQVLVDHARYASRLKRGGGEAPATLEDDFAEVAEWARKVGFEKVLQVNQALEKLEQYSERQAQIVQYRYFVGLTEEEIAELLSVTSRTVRNEWTRAKVWLREAMQAPSEE